MRRRDVLKMAVGATALAAPLLGNAQAVKPLRFAPVADLAALDPVWTSARPTRNHAFLVFDMLYGLDESFAAQPQMVAGHTVEEDGKIWTLTLRDNLPLSRWHASTWSGCSSQHPALRRS